CSPTFPCYNNVSNLLRDLSWLFQHPQVCKVAFEAVVGPSGGGSADAQVRAVAQLMCHLGVPGEPADVARDAFDENSYTFFRGQIGAWRLEFKPEHIRAFNERYRDILELYNYEVAS